MAQVDVTRIASNIGALNALNSLQNINTKLAMHQTRLSTGRRINSAADDPAGLTIATKMLSRSEGLKVAYSNIGDASNMLSVAEAGLSKMNDIMVIMRNKAEQAASDTLGADERGAIRKQLESYAEQIDAIVNETKWNNTVLLDGTINKQFQTGVDASETTIWQLSQKHDANTLQISTVVAADSATNQVYNSSGAGTLITQTAAYADLVSLETGGYKIKTLDVATSSTVGKLTTSGTTWSNTTGLTAVAVTDQSGGAALGLNATTTKLANGASTFEVVSGVTGASGAATLTFKVTTAGVAATYTHAAVTDGANDLGGGISLFVTDTNVAIGTGTMALDFVQADSAKYTLQHADGSSVGVDNNNANNAAANVTTTNFYVVAGATYNSGVGMNYKAATDILDTKAQENIGVSTFDFAKKSSYSVDVSDATKASAYMTKVNTAMNIISGSMATLGSLMARLDFKGEQVANAQVNVEGAYSRIMNANMAEEQMNASKYSILQQTAVAMLAQANQAPQSLLTLFR